MSATLHRGDDVFSVADGCPGTTYHNDGSTAAFNRLASWMLQRLHGQRHRWYVSMAVRGLSVTALAVQDDFGNLQLVELL